MIKKFFFTFLFKENMKSVKKTLISKQEAQAFGVPDDCRDLVEICEKHVIDTPGQNNSDVTPTLFLVRTKRRGREIWFERTVAKMSNEEKTNEGLRRLREGATPVDIFDSGIVFLADVNNEDGKFNDVRTVCRSHDFPHEVRLAPSLISNYFDRLTKNDADIVLREWMEGTIVRTFTLTVNGVVHRFISTRSRISAERSRPPDVPAECPTIQEMFEEAVKAANIPEEQIFKVGICHSFVVMNSWNQIRNKQETSPSLLLFGSYQFMNADAYVEYIPIETNLEGVRVIEPLTPAEAAKIVAEGRVVMTNRPFNNNKFMSEQTAREYRWLSGNPVMSYFEMLSSNTGDLQAFEECLHGWRQKKVQNARDNIDVDIESTVQYIYDSHINMMRVKGFKPPFHDKSTINGIIKTVRSEYREAKDEWLQKRKTIELAKAQKTGKDQNDRKPRFLWGRSHEEEERLTKESIRQKLLALKETDGGVLFTVMRECSTYHYQEVKHANQPKEPKPAKSTKSTTRGTQRATFPVKTKAKQNPKKEKRKKQQKEAKVKSSFVEKTSAAPTTLSWGEYMEAYEAKQKETK